MDWSQAAYVTALVVAVYAGRPAAVVIAVLVINLVWTMQVSASPVVVGIIDLLSCAALIGVSARANVIAAIFAIMVPVYVIGTVAELPNYATYTTVDLLAYAQLGVAGGLDRGIAAVRRRFGDHGPAHSGGEAGRLDRGGAKEVDRG